MFLRTRSYIDQRDELFTITQLFSHKMSSRPLDAKPLFHSGVAPLRRRGFPFFDDRMLAMAGRTASFHARPGPIHPTPSAVRIPAESQPEGRPDGVHDTRAARSGSWPVLRRRAAAVGPPGPGEPAWRGGGGHRGIRPPWGTTSSIAQCRSCQNRPCQTIRIYS